LNKSFPRNHQERTAASRGGGGRFLLGESQDLSQRADDNDIAAATLLPGVDFDPINERTDDFDGLRACCLIPQDLLQFGYFSAIDFRKVGMDGDIHVPLLRLQIGLNLGHCQTNLNGPAKGACQRRSGRQLTPLGQGGRTVLFEDIAALEVTVLVEVIVDRGMGSGKLLEGFHVPKLRHRSFSSSERLVGILSPIVEPPTALLIGSIADYFHRRSVRPKPVGYN
jgi:hypothetical protein